MKFPELTGIRTVKAAIGQFLGLNERQIINPEEFSDMENISSSMFPGITTRKMRGKVRKKLSRPHGLFWKNGLFYIDGTEAFYKEQKVFEVSDSDKILVGMGAYICIWPDKMVFNTNDATVKNVVQIFRSSGSVSINPTSSGSTFIRISTSGIGRDFAAGDGVLLSGFTSYGQDLNVSKIIQERGDDYIVVIAEGVGSFSQSTAVEVKRDCPDMDFICEFNNRLWGCSNKNHEVYASKLGDPLNWNAFEGLSTDSYALPIGSDGDFTGVIPYQGFVVFFKEDCIHTIFGTKPSNYQLDTNAARGVAKGCEKSLCRVDENVFYASRKDICIYQGAIPESISDKLSVKWTEAAANQQDSKLYLSLKIGGKWSLYVYDMDVSSVSGQKLWYKEDDLWMKYSCFAEGVLHLVDGENQLRTLYEEEEDSTLTWKLVSGVLQEADLNKKKIHALQFNLSLSPGALFEVFIRYDDSTEWRKVYSLVETERMTRTVPLKIGRCFHYQYMLRGIGNFQMFGMSRIVEAGSSHDR